MSTQITTGKVRFSYCNLFTPRAVQEGATPKYSVTLLIPKSDKATMQKIKAAMDEAILTNAVRDYTVYMTVDHQTENTAGGSGDASFASHKHAYKGKKAFKVHLGLKAGEQVLLLRTDGGQKFIIIDRVEAPT